MDSWRLVSHWKLRVLTMFAVLSLALLLGDEEFWKVALLDAIIIRKWVRLSFTHTAESSRHRDFMEIQLVQILRRISSGKSISKEVIFRIGI